MDYCHAFSQLEKHWNGKEKLSVAEYWELNYSVFGALDQIDRLKAREKNIRNCFDYSFVEHQKEVEKKVPVKIMHDDGTFKFAQRPVLDEEGNPVLTESGKPKMEIIYEMKTFIVKTYDVEIKAKKTLSADEFAKLKSLFKGIEVEEK